MNDDCGRVFPQVEITRVAPEQEPALANLLELYAHDFSEFHDLDLSESGRFGYPSLPLYWSEADRHPFFIRIDGKLAGLVLVKKGSQLTSTTDAWDMAEFFIVRRWRRREAGIQAAHQIWRRFPGMWEVRVMQKNPAALQFWNKAISTFAKDAIHARAVEKDGICWSVFSFQSDPTTTSNTAREDIH